jgi:hypothetical protein
MSERVDVSGLGLPNPGSVRLGQREYRPGADRGVAVLLTAASWVIQRLPGQVVERQRAELVRTLGEARNLTVEVGITPQVMVRIRDGQRLLVEIPSGPRP